MKKNSKIYIAGHTGLVGSSIIRKLEDDRYKNILTFSHSQLDLTNKGETESMFKYFTPDYVFLAAAKVGGVYSNNTLPGEYLYDNIMIETNIIEAARKYGVKKLLFLGSSCIYPRNCPQPIKEEYIMTAPLEPTNSAYALAKITGIEMCKAYRKQYGCDFISVIPCNLYGPHDNFSLMHSHVLPAMIRKFHDAKISGVGAVELWGDGSPRREFLHVDDLAEAAVFLMEEYDNPGHINIGAGEDVPIKFLAKMIADIIEYKGEVIWNMEYPNGTPKKLLDSYKINEMGWKSLISLERGIKETYEWFLENYNNLRK